MQTLLAAPIAEPATAPGRPAVFDRQATTAAALAGVAVAGRGITFLIAGATPLYQLILLLLVGIAACAQGTIAARNLDAMTIISRLFTRFGQRAGAVQTVLGVALIALHML